MDRREIARLICKTLGLVFGGYAILYFSGSLGSAIEMIMGTDSLKLGTANYIMAWFIVIPLAANVSLAAVFWFAADWLALRMVSFDQSPVTSLTISIAEITAIVFSACGIFIFVDGIAELTAFCAGYMYFQMRPDRVPSEGSLSDFLMQSAYYGGSLWKSLLQIAFGLWLMIGSRGIVGIFRRLRKWGVDAPEQSKDSEDPT